MRQAPAQHSGFREAAGLRLRCFLDRALWLCLLALAVCGASRAQIDIQGPIHLTHVEGYLTDTSGKPVAGVEVTLSRDEKVVFTTSTDGAGAFHFDRAAGRFWLRVARSAYAPAAREVVVGDEVVTHLRRRKLYVVLGPGACMDECSSIFTSRNEFEQAIRKNDRH